MKYGVIIRNLTDLRARPEFRSERKSQLLFGEPLEVSSLRKGYFRVRQNDGYTGWVDERAVYIVGQRSYLQYSKSLNYQIISRTAQIGCIDKSMSAFPAFLFYGTKLHVLRKQGNVGVFAKPKGELFKVSLKNMSRLSNIPAKDFRPQHIIREAKKFLATPYLWGGTGPYGFDCSGLVKSVYGRFGIYLPRDCKDQKKAGRKISSDEIRCGDLLFFPGHVAIAIDKYLIIHASLGEGGVAFSSMKPEDANFRKDLLETFLEARRVIV